MSNEEMVPGTEAPKGNTGKVLGISIGVIVGLVVACVGIPICVIVILAILGPAIGDVFSNVVVGL